MASETLGSATDRAVPVSGAVNMRDVGGLHTTDGRTVRRGRLVRSDALGRLTDDDVRHLVEELGLALVIDLRTSTELESEGRGPLLDTEVEFTHLSLLAGGQIAADVAPDLAGGELTAHYLGYLLHSSDKVVEAVGLLADERRLPAVVHCAAGKDRTGVVVALVLDAIGVVHDEIVADYVATGPNLHAILDRLKDSALFRDIGIESVPEWVFTAEAETMSAFLDHLAAEHGGSAGWLLAHGLPADRLEALRANLLD